MRFTPGYFLRHLAFVLVCVVFSVNVVHADLVSVGKQITIDGQRVNVLQDKQSGKYYGMGADGKTKLIRSYKEASPKKPIKSNINRANGGSKDDTCNGLEKKFCQSVQVQGLENGQVHAVDTNGNLITGDIPKLNVRRSLVKRDDYQVTVTSKTGRSKPILITKGEKVTLIRSGSIKKSKKINNNKNPRINQSDTTTIQGDKKAKWTLCANSNKGSKECQRASEAMKKSTLKKSGVPDKNKKKDKEKTYTDKDIKKAIDNNCATSRKKLKACTPEGKKVALKEAKKLLNNNKDPQKKKDIKEWFDSNIQPKDQLNGKNNTEGQAAYIAALSPAHKVVFKKKFKSRDGDYPRYLVRTSQKHSLATMQKYVATKNGVEKVVADNYFKAKYGDVTKTLRTLTSKPGPISPVGKGGYGARAGAGAQSGRSGGGGGSTGGLVGGILSGIGKALGKAAQKKPRRPAPPSRPKPICNAFGSPDRTIVPGETTTLRWALTDSDFAAISAGVGRVDPRGGIVVISPDRSTDYVLQARNRYGTAACPTVHMTVLASEDPQNDRVQVSGVRPEVSCTPRIARGASGIVLWRCPIGARGSAGSSTEYSEFTTYNKLSGSARVAPETTSTFVVRCRDSRGREVGRNSCRITVGAASATASDQPLESESSATARIVANKQEVNSGDIVTIEWEGRGTDNCTVTGPDGFTEPGNKGSVTGKVVQTSTFKLACTSNGGNVTPVQVTIRVI